METDATLDNPLLFECYSLGKAWRLHDKEIKKERRKPVNKVRRIQKEDKSVDLDERPYTHYDNNMTYMTQMMTTHY